MRSRLGVLGSALIAAAGLIATASNTAAQPAQPNGLIAYCHNATGQLSYDKFDDSRYLVRYHKVDQFAADCRANGGTPDFI